LSVKAGLQAVKGVNFTKEYRTL